MELDDVTETIIDHAFQLHRRLGPGLLEHVYEALLAASLLKAGLSVERQRAIPLHFDDHHFAECYRADLIVGQRVLAELKALEKLARVHTRQVNTYLKVTGLPVALLINFGAPLLRDGLIRFVNGLPAESSPALRVNRQAADPPPPTEEVPHFAERAAPPRAPRE